jgi:phospholipid/cholesterol/gamma-HCH transport system substrate-binding protein
MKFKIRFAEQVVGIFVLLAIVAVAAILIFVGVNQRWFARNYHFTSRFETGGGLAVGMPIMLKGFEIGKVSRVSLNEDNQVDIEFSIQDTYYGKVLPYSILELTSSPIGLGVTLKFHPGAKGGPPVEEGSFIPSLDIPEGRALVEQELVVIPRGEDVIGSVIAKVNPILEEVRTTLTQIKRLVTNVDAALAGKGGPLGEAIAGLAATPAKVNRVVDETGLKVNDIASRVNAVLGKIDTVSADLMEISRTTKGTLGTLSTDLEAITANLKTTTEGLRETRGLATRLLDPKGSLDTILNDQNALYKQVDSALKSTNAVIAQLKGFVEYINSTRPQISSILEKGRDTLEQGKEVLEAVKNNPLLRGGVPVQQQQTSTLKSYRDEDF